MKGLRKFAVQELFQIRLVITGFLHVVPPTFACRYRIFAIQWPARDAKAHAMNVHAIPGRRATILLREDRGRHCDCSRSTVRRRATALSEELIAALERRLRCDRARRRPSASVIVAANGPAFSAGHDLKELTARRSDPDGGKAYFRHIMTICSDMMQKIVALPQPVIACVSGVATAAGCQLVATCDLAVASNKRNSQRRASISGCSVRRRWWR